MLSLGCILISDLVVAHLLMHSLSCRYDSTLLGCTFLHQRWFCMEYIHSYTHTYKHTHIYAHIHTHMYTDMHTHRCKHTHTYTPTHTHMYRHTYTYIHTHAHVKNNKNQYIQDRMITLQQLNNHTIILLLKLATWYSCITIVHIPH